VISIEVIDTERRLFDLRSEWSRLLEESPSDCVFLTWEWLSSWWLHVARRRRLFVLAVRRDGELTAIAPLTVRRPGLTRGLPFTSLEFLGSGTVGSDYLDLIAGRRHGDEALPALADFLARAGWMLELGQARSGWSQARRLAGLLEERGWSAAARPAGLCRYIPLSGHTFESYLATLGREHRYNYGRRVRALTRKHDLRFETVTTEGHRREALRQLVALHNARWAQRGGSNAFHAHSLLAFHEEISRLACERGWLRVFLLWLDGRPAAGLYGFRYGRVFYFYQSGFDPRCARHSVGLVTMGLAIRAAIEEGAEEFDMLQGVEGYKARWAREARALQSIDLYPPSVRGLIYRSSAGAIRAARGAARRVLPGTLVARLAAGRDWAREALP
jgi:CelD/BcsL family acetyltransferase involved in cellulose biosynthesis